MNCAAARLLRTGTSRNSRSITATNIVTGRMEFLKTVPFGPLRTRAAVGRTRIPNRLTAHLAHRLSDRTTGHRSDMNWSRMNSSFRRFDSNPFLYPRMNQSGWADDFAFLCCSATPFQIHIPP